MTVHITIIEKERNIPIPFLLVELKNINTMDIYIDDTDNRGVADFDIPDGKYLIRLRHQGYRPYTRTTYLSRNSILKIILQRAY